MADGTRSLWTQGVSHVARTSPARRPRRMPIRARKPQHPFLQKAVASNLPAAAFYSLQQKAPAGSLFALKALFALEPAFAEVKRQILSRFQRGGSGVDFSKFERSARYLAARPPAISLGLTPTPNDSTCLHGSMRPRRSLAILARKRVSRSRHKKAPVRSRGTDARQRLLMAATFRS